jgi:hypothetical protein
MTKAVAQRARKLLGRNETVLEELEIYQFACEVEAHDDNLHERLAEKFAASFDSVKAELVKEFGQPSRTGERDDDHIPLCGVYRFAVWDQDNMILFLAVAHEDRQCPFLLMLGTGKYDAKADIID